ncbi:MAG: hypothetical protein ABW106_08005 [Steroidobacteraceae bacterium]
MDHTRPDRDAYLSKIADFIGSQPYVPAVGIDALKRSSLTQELGITSLGAIALVASYINSRGLSDSDLNPEWVPSLYEVDGLVAVFREIDTLANRAVAV